MVLCISTAAAAAQEVLEYLDSTNLLNPDYCERMRSKERWPDFERYAGQRVLIFTEVQPVAEPTRNGVVA